MTPKKLIGVFSSVIEPSPCVDYNHVPGGFAVGAEPVKRPGEAPREEVSSKNGWGWGGGVMREFGALVQGGLGV